MIKIRALDIVFWAVMIAAPLAAAAVALSMLPPGVEQLPMQWGWDGKISRYGSPAELWLLGGIMSGVNVLLFLCFLFNDALYNYGLVHGTSRKGALVVYRVVALVLVATAIGALALIVSMA